MKAINIKDKHKLFSKQWHPHRIAMVDNMQVILAKIKGEFVWHRHENEDELFQVVKGTLYMQFRDRTEVVNEGEIIVVPKGVEHNPSTKPKNNQGNRALVSSRILSSESTSCVIPAAS